MTPEQITSALADRGLTDAIVRLDYAGESYRITVEREHNARRVSHSKRIDTEPTQGDLDALAHAFKQWWDEARE